MGQAKRKRYATARHEGSHVVVGLDLPEVRDILERRWHDVELIAGLLLKRGRITARDLAEPES